MKSWEELTIADDFLFQKVMQNEDICKKLIEKILKKKIKAIHYHINEKQIKLTPDKKSVRLDIFVETLDGVIIDIEMQTSNKSVDWLPKRSRYYQAMIDLNTLAKGESYKNLQESYVIFICTFAPFGKSQKVYTFTNRCHEEELELNDKETKIFLNSKGTKGDIDEDTESFLNYIESGKVKGNFVEEVAREVEKLKAHDALKVEYMSFSAALADERDEGREEGRNEGAFTSNLHSIKSIMESFKVPLDKAMDVIKIPKAEQAKYRAKILAAE